MNLTRRSMLKVGVGGAAVGLSGCVASPFEGENSSDTGYAAFFALWDWGEHVAGDHIELENPIDAGQMGHGWSPDGDITRNIASSGMFIYLDTPEFSWAQDVAAELERDYGDVMVVDLLDGLDDQLLRFDSGALPEPDRGHEYPPESLQLEEFDIYDLRGNDQLGYWHTDHWHGGIPDVELDGTVPIGIVLLDDDERVVPLGAEETYQLDARIADGEPDDILDIESHGDFVELHGRSLGTTAVVLQIRRGDELIYETDNDPADVEVLEEIDSDSGIFFDPHAWVDPVLAQEMVASLADAFADADPDNEADYRENADAYIERLESVHTQFEELAENAERNVAVLAAHDAFGYLENRYGFELRTPTGISPDADVAFNDISGLIDTIEAHDIDTVLYDPFEAPNPGEDIPQMVEVLFEHTDATNAEPLSPAEGTTTEWDEMGWGWVEQMEEMNLPSLRAALGAE